MSGKNLSVSYGSAFQSGQLGHGCDQRSELELGMDSTHLKIALAIATTVAGARE